MREQSVRIAAISKNLLRRFELRGCDPRDEWFYTPCVTGLFYNGLAIDLTTSASTKGVTFQFRDTALGESSFEVLRRQVVDGSAVGTYESIVLIDSDIPAGSPHRSIP